MTHQSEGTYKDESRVQMSNPAMTVAVAQNFYTAYGDDTEGLFDQFYANLSSKQSAELANDNYLDALQLTALMIRKSKSAYRMLTGCTAEAFIGHLRDHFAEMIHRLHQAGRNARLIILNSDKRSEFLSNLAAQYPTTLAVEYATTPREALHAHFIVADDMVRVEKPHPRLLPQTPANVVQARVLFNNRGAALIYEAEFDAMWDRLRKSAPATAK
jgi:hypothetical protein